MSDALPVDTVGAQPEVRVGLRVPVDVDQRHYQGIVAALDLVLDPLEVRSKWDVWHLVGAENVATGCLLIWSFQHPVQDFRDYVDVVELFVTLRFELWHD